MGCSTCLCKSVLSLLNVIVMLVGLTLAIIGIILQAAAGSTFLKSIEGYIKDILGNIDILSDENALAAIDYQELFEVAAIILIVVGLFIACIAFLGVCGTSCDYHIILILYTIILSVIVLAQVIVVILFFTKTLDPAIENQVESLVENKYGGIDDFGGVSVLSNVLMLQYNCCGIHNYTDFNDAKNWRRTRNLTIADTDFLNVKLVTPIACCKSTAKFPEVDFVSDWCAVYPNDTVSNWNYGCWDAVTEELNEIRTPAILIISAILVIEAAVVLVAIFILKMDD